MGVELVMVGFEAGHFDEKRKLFDIFISIKPLYIIESKGDGDC